MTRQEMLDLGMSEEQINKALNKGKTVKKETKTVWGFRSELKDGRYEYSGLQITKNPTLDKHQQEWEILTFGMWDGIPTFRIASPQTDLRTGEYPTEGIAVVSGGRLSNLLAK